MGDGSSVLQAPQAVLDDLTSALAKLDTVITSLAGAVADDAGSYVRQDSNGTIALETGGNLATTVTHLASALTKLDTVVTNLAGAVAADAGSYVRQDSTGTMALETGGNLAAAATSAAAIADSMAPTACAALGAKTAGAAWDADSDELTIPADTELLHVYTDEDVYLLVDASADDPATDGAIYVGGQTHVVPCSGSTKLHYKRAGASDAAVAVTAFGN